MILCLTALASAGKKKNQSNNLEEETSKKTKSKEISFLDEAFYGILEEKKRAKKAQKLNETLDPEDPLVKKLFDVEARVTAWNDQFGADALRKERITRKISNTMRDLIAKTRSAARNADCREPLIGFRSGGRKETVKEEQVLRKIDDITKTYQSIADEYISGKWLII